MLAPEVLVRGMSHTAELSLKVRTLIEPRFCSTAPRPPVSSGCYFIVACCSAFRCGRSPQKTSLPPRPSAPHWPWPAPSVRSRLFPQCKPGGRVLPRRHSLRAGFCPRDEHTGLGLGSCWDQREERLVFCLATGKLHVFIPLHKNLSAIC